jgi:hypothetical protein
MHSEEGGEGLKMCLEKQDGSEKSSARQSYT